MTLVLNRKKSAKATPVQTHDLGSGGALPTHPFVALVPGTAAPLVRLDLPEALKGQARDRVAARQLRDAYGGSDAGLDLRPARLAGTRDGWSRVLVADIAERQDWARAVAPAGALCRAVLPDYLALPAAPDLWVIEACGDHIRARLGPEDGFSGEADLALTLLEKAAALAPPRAVLRLGAAAPEIDAYLDAQNLTICGAASELAAHGVTDPQVFGHGEFALDLARDPGAERAEMRRRLRQLRLPAGLAVLGLVGWVAATVMETRELRDQSLAYRQNAERILRDVMIPTGPILDIRTQVTQRLERARTARSDGDAEARPLDVLRRAGAVLADHDGTITRVSYQPGAGLVIDVQLADFAALDALVSALRTTGVEPRVAQSVTREGAGIEAVLAMAVTQNGGRR
ncbi:GspL periplasmic domain protein [Roseovarius gaetbuli]|uniref:GspL periplasmic domain protein n=1 Tax=Roseovarius gaetbuli TaxID=1356575 RepID=A0A1X6ZBL5_9RHOB|nr:type II secretion system protein GspL [Roseovarius gaetbuli]SLN47041.1 GspL periplasmic domain protein [Roseovarius gaetbuli]